MTFHDDKDGSDKVVKATIGKSLLEVAHENDVDLEGECIPRYPSNCFCKGFFLRENRLLEHAEYC